MIPVDQIIYNNVRMSASIVVQLTSYTLMTSMYRSRFLIILILVYLRALLCWAEYSPTTLIVSTPITFVVEYHLNGKNSYYR